MTIKETKGYIIHNGLGKITFSHGLLKAIINKVLVEYPDYEYQEHEIDVLIDQYLEVSLFLKSTKNYDAKLIDRLQKDLVLLIKKSLALNCVLAININNDK